MTHKYLITYETVPTGRFTTERISKGNMTFDLLLPVSTWDDIVFIKNLIRKNADLSEVPLERILITFLVKL